MFRRPSLKMVRGELSGGGAIPSKIASLLCHLDDEFSSHVFEPVFQFDLLGYRHAIFGHGWPANWICQ